jgi:hypothetical protein
MTYRASLIVTVSVTVITSVAVLQRPIAAQLGGSAAGSFTLEQVLDYPFPDNLVSAANSAAIAWTFNERGARNIYVAEAPEFLPRRITPYQDDDGQELTNLALAPDGRTIVYVRGGDHGSNWPADGGLMPNPASSATQPRMQIWSLSTAPGATPKLLSEGDEPAIAPSGDRVAFVKDRRIWVAPLDGGKPAEQAFFAKGSSESPTWSPDGRQLAFVSSRDDHSFIGIFTDANRPIRYLAPSSSRDSSPAWSANGRQMAFIDMGDQFLALARHDVHRIVQDALDNEVTEVGHEHVRFREVAQGHRQRTDVIVMAMRNGNRVQLFVFYQLVQRQTAASLALRMRPRVHQQTMALDFQEP